MAVRDVLHQPLVVAPISRIFGTGLFSPVTYPIVCFFCGLAAYWKFSRTTSFTVAAWAFFAPQALFVYLECSFSPGVHPGWAAIPVVIAVVAIGYLSDQINTHYVWWITANIKVKREAVQRRRKMWSLRFNVVALTKEIWELEEWAASAEQNGEEAEAFRFRRQAGELRELREYPLGFVIPLYFIALLFAGASSTALLGAAFILSIVLAFRRPMVTMKLSQLISEVIVHAFVSWFSWDPKQEWVNSPGLFSDGLVSPFRRITQTVGCFVLLEVAFIPSIHLWGVGPTLSAMWLWSSQYEFFLNLLLPPAMLACTLIATGARPLWLQLEAIEWKEASEELESKSFWDAAVGRLLSSRNKLEREHVLLGTHAEYGYPVLLHKKLLREHMHIMGGSGSGKTSRILAPLIAQLIRAGEGAVGVVDLKGDMATFEATRAEAKARGRPFKFCTNVLGRASYAFNPLQQVNSKTTSISQFVETLMESLRLNHGDGYGSRFFSSQSRAWLLKTVKRFPNIASFEELRDKATTSEFFKNEAEMDRCREAISVIQQIAEVTVLNWKTKPGEADKPEREAIFMPDVVSENQVVYFWLPAIGETSTVREIANLVLYSLMTAKKAHKDAGGKQPCYLVIDEFQQMASEGFQAYSSTGEKFRVVAHSRKPK